MIEAQFEDSLVRDNIYLDLVFFFHMEEVLKGNLFCGVIPAPIPLPP